MKMRALLSTLAIATAVGAFQCPPPSANSALSTTALYEYIPSGFTKKSWAEFKANEKKQKEAKNLGRLGPRGFKSRSMQSFQEALERGEADHLVGANIHRGFGTKQTNWHHNIDANV